MNADELEDMLFGRSNTSMDNHLETLHRALASTPLSRPHSAAWYRLRHYSRAIVYLGIGLFCAGVWFAVIWGAVALVRAWS